MDEQTQPMREFARGRNSVRYPAARSYAGDAHRCLLWESGLPFGDPLDDIMAVEAAPDGLRHSGLSLGRVIFEVTESEEIKDNKHLRNVLSFYRKCGFRVSLDDFGSLDLLRTLRPDFIKLDMSLVRRRIGALTAP